MEKIKLPSIVLGTWSWGTGAAGGDQVFVKARVSIPAARGKYR